VYYVQSKVMSCNNSLVIHWSVINPVIQIKYVIKWKSYYLENCLVNRSTCCSPFISVLWNQCFQVLYRGSIFCDGKECNKVSTVNSYCNYTENPPRAEKSSSGRWSCDVFTTWKYRRWYTSSMSLLNDINTCTVTWK